MNKWLPLLAGEQHPTSLWEQAILRSLGGMGHIYGLIQSGRALAYKKNLLPAFHAPCPVISVGNLTAGGTGKTPMVLWLARYFQERHRSVAIVSRGYQQKSKKPITVVADPQGQRLTTPEAADEAVLLAHKLPRVSILTGTNRQRSIRYAVENFGCNIIILDDGYQHLQVHRELNIVLLDAHTPFGNGHILPGGILREWPSALERADGLILTRAEDRLATEKTQNKLRRDVPNKPIACATHQPTQWIQSQTGTVLPLHALNSIPALAFCGIGKPHAFKNTLAGLGVTLQDFKVFPDHHHFFPSQMKTIENHARTLGAEILLCTEKDIVKIDPSQIDLPIYSLSVEIKFLEQPSWLIQRLQTLLN